MTYISAREIDEMTPEGRKQRLLELREEFLQLRAQRAMGGSQSNFGDYKATRRTIARLLTRMRDDRIEA